MTDYTDTELCAAVAERVLGLHEAECGAWCDCKDGYHCTKPRDALILTWSGVGQIVEAMREKGRSFELAYSHERQRWSATFWSEPAFDDTAPRAVAVAAIRALEAM